MSAFISYFIKRFNSKDLSLENCVKILNCKPEEIDNIRKKYSVAKKKGFAPVTYGLESKKDLNNYIAGKHRWLERWMHDNKGRMTDLEILDLKTGKQHILSTDSLCLNCKAKTTRDCPAFRVQII